MLVSISVIKCMDKVVDNGKMIIKILDIKLI